MTALVLLLAQTTTTEVRRIVGDPPPTWVPIAAGVGVLLGILLLGWIATRRRRDEP